MKSRKDRPLIRKKGKKFPFAFLLVEFQKGDLLLRFRYKVVQQPYSGCGVEIRESGSKWSEASRVRENRVAVASSVCERMLFETLTRHVSEKERVPVDSITFRWENESLKMPIEARWKATY